MYTIWMSNKGPIFRPFGPQSQNFGVWSLFKKNFTGFTSVLLLNNTCSLQVLLDMCGIWALSRGPNSAFRLFCQKVSFEFTSVMLYMHIGTSELLSEMCIIWAQSQSPNLWAILGPKAKSCGLWSLSQKLFNGFTSVLLHMLIASTFICVENMGLRSPIFGPKNKSKLQSLAIL